MKAFGIIFLSLLSFSAFAGERVFVKTAEPSVFVKCLGLKVNDQLFETADAIELILSSSSAESYPNINVITVSFFTKNRQVFDLSLRSSEPNGWSLIRYEDGEIGFYADKVEAKADLQLRNAPSSAEVLNIKECLN